MVCKATFAATLKFFGPRHCIKTLYARGMSAVEAKEPNFHQHSGLPLRLLMTS